MTEDLGMPHVLSQREFDNLVSVYGADIKNWPNARQNDGHNAVKAGMRAVQNEINLDEQLQTAFASAPASDLLSLRIMKSAQERATMSVPANHIVVNLAANDERDNEKSFRRTLKRDVFKWRFAGIAAAALFVAGFVFYPAVTQTRVDEAWLEAASELGFDDVYDWVQSEDG
ncbi:MAG: hypothetical protein ACPGVT_07660 [Maricaulaceae bacterium]